MAHEQKPGTGTLFPNLYKTMDKHPDWKGTYTDNSGKTWDVAAWKKRGQQTEYLSFCTSEPFRKEVQDRPDPVAAIDDLPF